MQHQKLVVLAGYPSAGKSTVRTHLVEECSFAYVSSDEIRESLFGTIDFFKYQQHPLYGHMEQVVFSHLQLQKMTHLMHGKNIVIDSSAINKDSRAYLFHTQTEQGLFLAQKYLVYPEVDRRNLEERNKARGRNIESLTHWDKHWTVPEEAETYTLLHYPNNTEQDLEYMLNDLTEHFT